MKKSKSLPSVRCTPEQYEAISQGARQANMGVGEFVRLLLFDRGGKSPCCLAPIYRQESAEGGMLRVRRRCSACHAEVGKTVTPDYF